MYLNIINRTEFELDYSCCYSSYKNNLLYLSNFTKTQLLHVGFCLDSGAGALKPGEGGGGGASRLGWVDDPGPGLFAGGLYGVQLSKAEGRGGCLVVTPFAS